MFTVYCIYDLLMYYLLHSLCLQYIRYRKLSREISQAKWTVTEENDEYDEESSAAIEINQRLSGNTAEESQGKDMENSVESNCNTNSKLKCVRKGKMSVEEIVCEAVNHAMKAKTSRLHPWYVLAIISS